MKYLVSVIAGLLSVSTAKITDFATNAAVPSFSLEVNEEGMSNLRANNSSHVTNLGESIYSWGYEEILSDHKGSNCIGGGGGAWFQDHVYSTTVHKITVWGNGDHGAFSAIQTELFDGTRYVRGNTLSSGNPIAEFEFARGETLTGHLVLSGNGVGSRTGYLKFTTSGGQTFEAGSSSHDKYYTYAHDRFITGFFGRAGGEIDLLGVTFSKPIAGTSMSNVDYPTLNLDQPICQPPTQISHTHVENAQPEGTKASTVEINYSKLTGEKDCWALDTGISFGQSYKIKGGVPFVEGGEATTTWSIKQEVGYNSCSESQTTVTEDHIIAIAPQQDCNIYVTQCQATLDSIPYSADYTMVFHDGTEYSFRVSGSYQGADASVTEVNPVCVPLVAGMMSAASSKADTHIVL